jgi:MFS family permease
MTNSEARPPRLRELRRLAVTQLVVLSASQFWFVLLAWLLIERSRTGSVVGTVLMIGALPRTMLITISGALIDRVAPGRVLRCSVLAMSIVLAGLAVVAHSGGLAVWHLVVAAALLGACDAFFLPAVGALIPQLAGDDNHRANAVVQMGDQIAQIIGPVGAGFLLARSGETTSISVNALLCVIGLVAFVGVGVSVTPLPLQVGGATLRGLLAETASGLRFAWRDAGIRACMIVAGGLSLATVGPISVGGTLLATERLGGAGSLGIFLGAFGAGALGGVVVAGLRRPSSNPQRMLLVLCVAIGVGLASLAVVPNLSWAIVVAAPTGVVGGYAAVAAATYLQRLTPPDMQGRMAALMMLAYFGLDPVSQGLTGLLIGYGTTTLFLIAACISLVIALAISRSGSASTDTTASLERTSR